VHCPHPQIPLKHTHTIYAVCSVWDKGYRYGFNSMEKDNEINVNGGNYDFGARIYDSRLGRWLSLDPLQMKYPNYTPYNFALNIPIAVRDYNGGDAVVTINNTGTNKGNTINVKSTVILYGPDAKNVNLESLNSKMQALGAPRTFLDENGKEWTIQFDITFVVSDPLTKYANDLSTNGKEDEYRSLELSDNNRTLPENIKNDIGFKQGDNILRVNDAEFPGTIKGSTGQGANGGTAANYSGSIIHESFHMLGYGDRYYAMTGNYDVEFFEDVVGGQLGGPDYIHPVHYIDLINFVNNDITNLQQGVTTKTYGFFKLSLDQSCSGEDSCTKSQEEKDKAKKSEVKQ